MKQITYSPEAVKSLRRIPAKTALRIVGTIEAYAANPAAQANNVKALRGSENIRLRVGDWRVVIHDGHVMAVLAVGPRGGIYD